MDSFSEIEDKSRPNLSMLVAQRPRNLDWKGAAALLFGDWGTSRLYVLGLAFFFAGPGSLWLVAAMSLLVLAVGWAYTQICRIYPDGGGVYTAAKHRSTILAVFGALLLFSDYVITASLSSLEAFHYFFPLLHLHGDPSLWSLHSEGLWAIVAIVGLGAFNLLGPKHTAQFAISSAAVMVLMTTIVAVAAIFQIDWNTLPSKIGSPSITNGVSWTHFVAIVLALSGVEAIGNMTGVMKRPVFRTARIAIWIVALEVALLNLIMAFGMASVLSDSQRSEHQNDMIAFLAGHFVGPWAEFVVRIAGSLLLLSAVNTVVISMIGVQYLMSRDGELPRGLQRLNRYGVPILPTIVATLIPAGVLVFVHEVQHLAELYAIGVVGAVAINISLVTFHPRLHGWWRHAMTGTIAVVLIAIWFTLAVTKWHALLFVCGVLLIGMAARVVTKKLQRGRGTSMLRKAISEQLDADTLAKPRAMLCTYGSDALAATALDAAAKNGELLVVCFVREIRVGLQHGFRLGLDQDPAAARTFKRFLEIANSRHQPILPVYDSGPNAIEVVAEMAATSNVNRILIGSSRRGPIERAVKGSFQQRLEALLPPEIKIEVIGAVNERIGPPPAST